MSTSERPLANLTPEELKHLAESPVTYNPEVSKATMGKGQSAEKEPANVLVLDTGNPAKPDRAQVSTKEEQDEVYLQTIARGVVDHHTIDSKVHLAEGLEAKCATRMAADYPDAVLKMMRERGTTEIKVHNDSDLDAVSSAYLATALIGQKEHAQATLPTIATELGEFANQVDFGRYRESDAEAYSKSLMGLFAGIKRYIDDKIKEQGGAIWGDQVKTPDEKRAEYGKLMAASSEALMKYSFALLNACNEYKAKNGSIDLKNLDLSALPIKDEKLLSVIQEGLPKVKEEFTTFNSEFAAAEAGKRTITVMGPDGKPREAVLYTVTETTLSPTTVTNMAYVRVPDNAIVAVFAGPERTKGGDMYDIGMKTESTDRFNLRFMVAHFNQLEAKKRAEVFGNLDALAAGTEQPTEAQQLWLNRWRLTPAQLKEKWTAKRKGYEDYHGDPTVCVSQGDSLVAASNTSLLTPEDFSAVLSQLGQEQAPLQQAA